MKAKDFLIGGIALVVLLGSIIIAIRPQSNLVRLEEKDKTSPLKIKEAEENPRQAPKQRSLPPNIEPEQVAQD